MMSFCLYNKKNITQRLEDMNFIFSWQKQYFTHSLRSFVKYCFCHSKIKFISSWHSVISSMYWACKLFFYSDFHVDPPQEPLRILLIAYVPDQCSISAVSIQAYQLKGRWNLWWSQLVPKHRFESKCSTKFSPMRGNQRQPWILDSTLRILDSRLFQSFVSGT